MARHEPTSEAGGDRARVALSALDGLTRRAVAEFCDAIEFGVHNQAPSEAELLRLRRSLDAIAREAHAARLTPERVLVALKRVWSIVCGRHPDPDMFDEGWSAVVREWLAAYEAARSG